ncbi:MAG: serine protease [Planctomycetota bacterium]
MAVPLEAQAPGVVVHDQSFEGVEREEQGVSEEVAELAEADQLLSLEDCRKLMRKPVARALQLPAARGQVLDAAGVHRLARGAFVRVGWCYLCTRCDNWHTELACGYLISKDGGIATCAHVLEEPAVEMRQASLVAVDANGSVHPVRSIVAVDEAMDAAVVTIAAAAAAELAPIAFDDQVRPGDMSYCKSRPMDQRGFYSAGMVNRFYLDRDTFGAKGLPKPQELSYLRAMRMDVDIPWAPGSSGAAILNARGNVIGHVSEIRPLSDMMGMPPRAGGPERAATMADVESAVPLITIHVAIPARSVRALLRTGSAPGDRKQ